MVTFAIIISKSVSNLNRRSGYMSKSKLLTLGLLMFLSPIWSAAQKPKQPRPNSTPADIFATKRKEPPFEPLISDFAFVADLAANGQAKITLQAYEHTDNITAAEFDTIYKSFINGGVYENSKLVRNVDPVIIIRPGKGILYGDLVNFAGPLRTFGPNTIKVAVGDNEYVVVPAAIKEDNLEVKPNPLTLIVNVNGKLNIDLNREPYGNISFLEPVSARLRQVFREREDNGVFRPDTNFIEKTVGIRLPANLAFEHVIKLVTAIRNAGSDQIAFIFEPEIVIEEQILPPIPDGIVDLPPQPKPPKKKRSRK